MNSPQNYQQALAALRQILAQLRMNEELSRISRSREEVLARFQPVFSSEHLPQLSEAEFHAFLLFKNNRHWSGLQRYSPKMRADMSLLRSALAILVSESQPVEKRLDQAVPMVHGMGKAVATAILLIANPGKYGVWNNVSEGGLKTLKLWPRFERGESLGTRYVKINKTLERLSEDLPLDLWTLDTLWWGL